MKERKCEFLIVGSGAGGATLARELSKRGREVLVIEKGRHEKKVGTVNDAVRFYDGNRLTWMPLKTKEGVTVWRTFMAGGTTVVSCGNGVRSLERELAAHGIGLEAEFAEAEQETAVAPIDERLISDGSRSLMAAARDLGYQMALMPKFIDPVKCKACAQCVVGCAAGAKWTAIEYLVEASRLGAEVMYETAVNEVVVENGQAVGVRGQGPAGAIELQANTVVLAAGGLGTPVILQRSGVREAGEGLFVDLLVDVYGVTRGLNLLHEPQMSLVDLEFHAEKGFLLSTYAHTSRRAMSLDVGARGLAMPLQRVIGMMVKTADDADGRVFPDGSVSKPVRAADRKRLDEGVAIATEILVRAGADRESIVVGGPQGAHPGGTAAIGKVVDSDLQTKIERLFVCDASVLPKAPGLPPILTIVALAKRLARTLAP